MSSVPKAGICPLVSTETLRVERAATWLVESALIMSEVSAMMSKGCNAATWEVVSAATWAVVIFEIIDAMALFPVTVWRSVIPDCVRLSRKQCFVEAFQGSEQARRLSAWESPWEETPRFEA